MSGESGNVSTIETISGNIESPDSISGNIETRETISGNLEGAFVQNLDYNPLANKPQIEHRELIGNKSFSELGLEAITEQDIDRIIFGG